jgi:hypothetical protein
VVHVVLGFATIITANKSMIELIVCPLWVANYRHYRSRQYLIWDRPCSLCGRKVIVSAAVKRQLDSGSGAVIVCEQCASIQAPKSEIEALSASESNAIDNVEQCATCAALKEQEESAEVELARCKDLPNAKAARMKWAHLFDARWAHQFKAHNSEPRGRG